MRFFSSFFPFPLSWPALRPFFRFGRPSLPRFFLSFFIVHHASSPSHPSPPCLKPMHPSLPHVSSPCLKPGPSSSPRLKPMPSPCLKPTPQAHVPNPTLELFYISLLCIMSPYISFYFPLFPLKCPSPDPYISLYFFIFPYYPLFPLIFPISFIYFH